jgi:hypothetical protein
LRKTLVLVAALVAVIGAAVAATAAIPDSNGVIHACRNTKTGALRAIDSERGQTCSKDEAALTWNQIGPQGPAGPAGPQGPAGPAGPPGPAGVSGYEIIGTTKTVQVDAGQTTYGDFIDTCASRNKRPVGAGGFLSLPDASGETPNPAPGWSVGASYPFRNAEGSTEAWVLNFVRAPGGPAATYTLRLWAACVTST